MGERNVRYPAGPNEEGRTHRVGLTRHCLTSGLVQLPYALKDALPEGALLAHDLERDESIEVVFVPPRQLQGLDAFFRAHELLVNDEIELRVVAGDPPELRFVPLRRARSSGAEKDATDRTSDPASHRTDGEGGSTGRRQVSVWHSVRDERAAPARRRQDGEGTDSTDAAFDRPVPRDVGAESDGRSHRTPSTPPGPAGRTADAERGAPAAPRRDRPTPAAPALEADAADVVERFGSVTVRRLGTGTVERAPSSSLDTRSPDEATEPVLGIDPDAAFEAADGDPTDPIAAEDAWGTIEEPESLDDLLVGPVTDLPAGSQADDGRPDSQADTRSNAQADERGEASSDIPPDPTDEATSDDPAEPEVRQASLFDIGGVDAELAPAVPRAPAPRQAGRRSAAPRTAARRPAVPTPAAEPQPASARRRPKVLGRPGRAARPSSDAGGRPADDAATAQNAKPVSTPSVSTPSASAPPTPVSTPYPAPTAQSAREEALSRAGDLRSRIIRWMLAPETPVIVSIEMVQEAFELRADVARDIVEGILESPPPSLRLTRLRPDMLRVSRITVEQNA